MCSIQEPGLFDFLIVNDDLESSQQQLYQVAALALAGQDPAELDVKDDAEEAEARTEGPVNPKVGPDFASPEGKAWRRLQVGGLDPGMEEMFTASRSQAFQQAGMGGQLEVSAERKPETGESR